MLDINRKYSRKDNVVYDDTGKPVIKMLAHKFPDWEILSNEGINYINRYREMYPQNIEIMSEVDKGWAERNGPKVIKMFFDLETTGVDVRRHGIHQISGCFETNGEVVEQFNIHVQPNPKAVIEPDAMAICGVTEQQIMAYPPMKPVYHDFVAMLGKYVKRYDKVDKIWLVGYNNRSFDDNFLRQWFVQNDDTFFGAWFWTDSLDVLVLASQYLIDRRKGMPNFKLATVAKELGIGVDESRLHDALYDIELTRAVYRIVTGIDFEL